MVKHVQAYTSTEFIPWLKSMLYSLQLKQIALHSSPAN